MFRTWSLLFRQDGPQGFLYFSFCAFSYITVRVFSKFIVCPICPIFWVVLCWGWFVDLSLNWPDVFNFCSWYFIYSGVFIQRDVLFVLQKQYEYNGLRTVTWTYLKQYLWTILRTSFSDLGTSACSEFHYLNLDQHTFDCLWGAQCTLALRILFERKWSYQFTKVELWLQICHLPLLDYD